jgi:plastocyanin
MCRSLRVLVITVIVFTLLLAGAACSRAAMSSTPPATTVKPSTTTSMPVTTTSIPTATSTSPATTMTMPPTTTANPPVTTSSQPPTITSVTTGTVIVANYSFNPNSITVTVGTRVVWINQDMADHTVTSDTPGIFDQDLPAGGTTSITFTIAGTYYYHCSFHPEMLGTVIVK